MKAGKLVDQLLAFFRGAGTDSEGRLLDEILQWDDSRLEICHDYIQWLFPTDEPSAVNPDAPLIDSPHIEAFAGDAALRRNLARSFERMLAFYGLRCSGTGKRLSVERSAEWERRSNNWLTRNNHNHLRISRMLRSLNLLGLRTHASAFFEFLDELVHGPGGGAVSDLTYEFWKQAATPP